MTLSRLAGVRQTVADLNDRDLVIAVALEPHPSALVIRRSATLLSGPYEIVGA
jgi:hypothetical protein